MGAYERPRLQVSDIIALVRAEHPNASGFNFEDEVVTFKSGEDAYGLHTCGASMYGLTCGNDAAIRNQCIRLLSEVVDHYPGNSRTR